MNVKRNTLLLIACLVWGAAGVNILRIGLAAYPPHRAVPNYLLSLLVFTVSNCSSSGSWWIGTRRGSARMGASGSSSSSSSMRGPSSSWRS